MVGVWRCTSCKYVAYALKEPTSCFRCNHHEFVRLDKTE